MFYVIGKSFYVCVSWFSFERAHVGNRLDRPELKVAIIPSLVFFTAGGITVSIIAFVFTIKFLCELAARVVSFLQNEDPGRRGDRSIYDYVRGNYLDPRSCKVSWDWKEPQEVGQTMSFRVQVTAHNSPLGPRVSREPNGPVLTSAASHLDRCSCSTRTDSLSPPTGPWD